MELHGIEQRPGSEGVGRIYIVTIADDAGENLSRVRVSEEDLWDYERFKIAALRQTGLMFYLPGVDGAHRIGKSTAAQWNALIGDRLIAFCQKSPRPEAN